MKPYIVCRNDEVFCECDTCEAAQKTLVDLKEQDRALIYAKKKTQKLLKKVGFLEVARMIDSDCHYYIARVLAENGGVPDGKNSIPRSL